MTAPAAAGLLCKGAISAYLTEVDTLYRAGTGCPAAAATEHSYRPALQTLLEKITTGLTITNEPKRIACGAPDYCVMRAADYSIMRPAPGGGAASHQQADSVPLGYIEAKDIPVGIDNKNDAAQFERYRQALGNLIITNYISFRLFVDGEAVVTVTIARESGGGITPDKKQFGAFLELIHTFTGYTGKTIFDSSMLAKMMANKAKLLADVLKTALNAKEDKRDDLSGQFEDFKKILMHDINSADFAGVYAQTLAYGFFAAYLNQTDEQIFSRMSAPHLIPASNPFLRKFFQYIAGFDLDSRIAWIVDALADIFNYTDRDAIKKEFGRAARDPYIHFYETFLAEYDPAQRKARGVYYTPLSAVKFIVNAVDDILKTEFKLSGGLADYSKVKHKVKNEHGKEKEIEIHKVQILDPAAGTGTFLAEVTDKIYSYFENNRGAWEGEAGYCAEHLIPRLNGFEILMASYAMAHLKLDMKLKETGYSVAKGKSRLHIYLTNSLEDADVSPAEFHMGRWLYEEAEGAGRVKHDVPVMVVLGNPPYNVSTQNRNTWIDSLIADYKKDLNEKKLNLDDDYIKFIRYGQYLVERTGVGVLAYISNNSFIDGVTHRTMRRTLLEKFDKIYILNLHGNSRIKEASPYGSKDENVFDIMQGTSINIFIKTGEKKNDSAAKVYHSEIFGKRETKYDFLYENTLSTIKWTELNPAAPYFFFVPKDFSEKKDYENGFSVSELFTVFNNGIKTDRDSLFIDFEKKKLSERIKTLFSGKYDNQFMERYNVKDSGSYMLTNVIKNKTFNSGSIMTIQYRPFDYRFIYYEKGITSRAAYDVMKHFISKENTGLICSRQFGGRRHFISFITGGLVEISSQPYAPYTVFPLYLYEDGGRNCGRRPNLNMDIVKKISREAKMLFAVELNAEEYKTCYTIDGTPKENRASIRKHIKHTLQHGFPIAVDGIKEPLLFGSSGIKNMTSFGMSNPLYMKIIYHIRALLEFALPVHEKKAGAADDRFQKYIYLKSVFMIGGEAGNAFFVFGFNEGKWHYADIFIQIEKNNPPNVHPGNKPGPLGGLVNSQQTYSAAFEQLCQAGKKDAPPVFSPPGLLDYIYAVLYSANYRTQYAEFLKIDFPRVPYPASAKQFQKLAAMGARLRNLHLMENVSPAMGTANFPAAGSNEIESAGYKNEKVFINKTQYFDHVPAEVWEYYIGGYQPAQKWLKDRKGCILSFEDIEHYQKIIAVLKMTIELQAQIDENVL